MDDRRCLRLLSESRLKTDLKRAARSEMRSAERIAEVIGEALARDVDRRDAQVELAAAVTQ